MPKPKTYHLRGSDAAKTLLDALQRYYCQGRYVDVRFQQGERELVACHKLVLAAFSEYFEDLLAATVGDVVLNVDSLGAHCVQHLSSIVQFVYGFDVRVERSRLAALADAARQFGVGALVKALDGRRAEPARDGETSVRAAAAASLLLVRSQHLLDARRLLDTSLKYAVDGVALQVCAHRVVLAASSDVLAAAVGCSDDPLGGASRLDAVDALYIRQLPLIVDHIYGRSLKLNYGQLLTLHDAARAFGLASAETGELHRLRQNASQSRAQQSLRNGATSSSAAATTEAALTAERASYIRQSWQFSNTRSPEANASALVVDMGADFEGPFSAAKTPSFSPASATALPAVTSPSSLSKSLPFSRDAMAQESATALSSTSRHSRYMCPDCGGLFDSTGDLETHSETHHCLDVGCSSADADSDEGRVVAPFAEPARPTAPRRSRSTGAAPRRCLLCPFEASSLRALKSHISTEHDGSSDVCPQCLAQTPSRAALLHHLRDVHGATLFDCAACNKQFGKERALRLHAARAHPRPPAPAVSHKEAAGDEGRLRHSCSDCGARFDFRSVLNRHFKTVHLKMRPYQCPYCAHASTEKAALKTHIRSVHTREKPFVCCICKHSFTTQSQVARHMRVSHQTTPALVCATCGASFSERRDLTTHENRKHNHLRPHACASCERAFYRKDHLLVHRRKVHKEHV